MMQRNTANPQVGLCHNNEWCICAGSNGFSMYCEELQTIAQQNGLLSKHITHVNIICIQKIYIKKYIKTELHLKLDWLYV